MAEKKEEESKQRIGDDVDIFHQSEVVLHPKLVANEFPEEALDTKKNRSLMAKHLTREMFDKLKGLSTKDAKFTLARAINTGVKNPQSLMGIHAGDLESWTLFGDIFDKVIEEYHGGYAKDAVHPTLKEISSKALKGDIADISPIKSTRIRVARNIDGYALACGQNSVEEKLEIEEVMKKVFETFEGDLKGTYHPLDGMKEEVRMQFIKDHFLFKGKDIMQVDSGYHRWFPKGRGIFVNATKTFLMWINEGDHIRIISMEKGGNVRSVFDRLARAITAVEKGLQKVCGKGFMKTDHLGHISNCPTNLGTGLRGGVHIELPHLSKLGVDKLSEIGLKYHLQARGIHGEHSKSEGGIVDLSNKYRLGYNEVQLVQFLIDGLNEMMKMEKDLAAKAAGASKEE